jgi:hypothetical protein
MQFLEHHGFSRGALIVSNIGTLYTDRYGLDTATAEWKCSMDNFGLAPSLNTPHPQWSWLFMERRRVEYIPGFLVITGEYVGITGGRTPSQWECSYATTEEEIQTHPNFISDIAGTPQSPKHGAIFVDVENAQKIATTNDRGVFSEFKNIIDGGRNEFGGVRAFLSPQVTVRETWIATDRVSGFGIGTINTPAIGISITGNWLKTGVSFQQRGRVYQNTQEWRASGRIQWNPIIYSA